MRNKKSLNMIYRLISVGLLSLCCTGVFAQGLSLKDCMEYALEKSAKLRIQAADVDDARLARRDAILDAFTPEINAGTYTYSKFGRNEDPETNTFSNTTSFTNAYQVSGGIMLFNGFEAVNNIKISKTSLMMGVEQEQKVKDEICLATMEAFCNVVYYSKLSEIVQSQVETLKEALRLARKQEELGQKGYADVLQTEADLADMQYKLILAQNNRADALISLQDLMFWEEDEELEINLATSEERYHLDEFDSAEQCSQILDFALAHNPAVLIAKGKMDNAKLDLRTAKWKFAPNISLSGGVSSNYFTYPGLEGYVPQAFGDQLAANVGEYIQLSLSFPIYGKLQRHSNLRKKKNSYIRAEAEYDTALRQVRSEVERAIQDRDGTGSALFQAERREEMQEEVWNLNIKKFEQGLISAIDFRKASEDLLNAKAERLNAMLKWQLKRSVVKYYNGISYIDQF